MLTPFPGIPWACVTVPHSVSQSGRPCSSQLTSNPPPPLPPHLVNYTHLLSIILLTCGIKDLAQLFITRLLLSSLVVQVMVEPTPSIRGRLLSGSDLLTWFLLVPQDDLLTSSTPSSTTPLLTLPWCLHSSSSLDKLHSSLHYMCRLLCSKSLSASRDHSHVTWVFPPSSFNMCNTIKTFF